VTVLWAGGRGEPLGKRSPNPLALGYAMREAYLPPTLEH